MKRILKEYLPDHVSDETAFYLTHFFMTLALDIVECYWDQASRHRRLIRNLQEEEFPDPPF